MLSKAAQPFIFQVSHSCDGNHQVSADNSGFRVRCSGYIGLAFRKNGIRVSGL